MFWHPRRFFGALSIKSYVIFWVGCILVSCVALGSAWLATEMRLRRMSDQRELDVSALDAGRRLEARVLDEGRADLLWRLKGASQYKTERDTDLLKAESIAGTLTDYAPTDEGLRVIAELKRELKALRESNENEPSPTPDTLRSPAAALRDAVSAYIGLCLGDLDETNRVAKQLHAAEGWWWAGMMGLVAVLLVSGSLGLILRVVHPVLDLTRTAMRFGEGDYTVRAPVARDDEIGALGRTLNGMADNIARHMAEHQRADEALQKAHDELERRVQERTAELVAANQALQAEIVARGRMENALRESRERFRLIMESSPDTVSIFDRNLVYRWVLNPFPPRTPEEFIGKQLGCFSTSPEDVERRRRRAREVIETGQAVRFETSTWIAGAVRHFEVTYQPWRDAEGRIIGVAAYAHDVTERRHAEDRAREGERTVRALLDGTTESMILLDASEKVLALNETCAQRYGLRQDQILGKRVYDLVPPDLALLRRKRFEEALRTGRTVRFEDQRAGRWYDNNLYPICDAQGKVSRVAIFGNDITERKRAEESLAASERTIRTLLNATNDSVLLMDTAGTILALNDSTAQRLNLRAEDMLRHCLYDFFEPELARTRRAHFDEAVRTGQSVHFEDQRAGRWYDHTLTPVKNSKGSVMGVAIFARDTTQRREAEEALWASERTIRALLNATTDTLVLLEASGKILAVNESTAKRTGLSVDEIVGKNLFGLFSPEIGRARKARFDEVARSGAPARFEDEREAICFDNSVYPIRDSEGAVTRLALFARDITERKRAEQALRENEARFRSMFDDAPIGMTMVSTDNRILHANRAHCEFLGYSEQELVAMNIEDFTYPEDRQETLRLTRRQREGGPRIERHEKRYVRKNGEVVWGEVSVSVIRDTEGKFKYSIAQIMNITERKRAEQALRESEETIRAMLNATTDRVFLMDAAGKLLTVNETAAKGWGKRVDELVGACIYDFMLPPVAESRKARYDRAVQSGRAVHFEDEHRGIWFDTGVHPIVDSQGKVTRLAIFARDITERKHAEQALRESEERYRELFEASPMALVEEDWSYVRERADQLRADGVADVRAWFLIHPEDALRCYGQIRRMDVNKAALRLFKAAGKKELLANYGRLACEETRESAISAVATLAAGNEFFEAETMFRPLTGEKRNLLVSISAVPGAEKSLPRYIVSLSDVTDLRRAQQEAIEQRQAAQLQRMESLAVTGRLAAGIAHEINNPLQGIVAQLSLLSDELPESLRQGRRIKLIHGGIERIASIVRNLLQLHRAPPKGEESCEVSAVIPGLTELISTMVSSQRIRVEVSVSPPDMAVPMSANALIQVLLNLTLNAIDAMPEGGVIQIEAKRNEAEALVRVSDTGMGIPQEHRALLFSPFFTTKGPKGTGLGLSVTQSLVESAGGAIAASDREGGGTTFSIRFENRRAEA